MQLHLPKLHKKSSRREDRLEIYLLRDWIVVVSVCVLCIALDIIASLLLYRVQSRVVASDVAADLPYTQTIDREKLTSVVGGIKEKDARFQALWVNQPNYPSPY